MFLSLTSGLKMPHDTANNHWMIFDRGCSQWARIQQEGLVGVVCGGPGTGVCRLVLVSAPQLALHRAVSSSWTGAANLAPTITTTTAHTHPVLYINTLYCTPYTLHTLYCTPYRLNTLYCIPYTLNTLYYTPYTLNTLYFTLYTLYWTLYILNKLQYTLYCTMYTIN